MRSTACWPASTEHAPARRRARLRPAPGVFAAVLATLGWLHGAAADPPTIPAVAPAAGVAATGVQGLQALDRMLDGAAPAPAIPEAPATAVFEVAPEIGLAAFLRGGSLWLVFAGNAPIDGADLATAAARAFGEGRLAPSSDGVALRVALQHGTWPEIRRDGADWIVGLTDRPSAPETPLEVRAEPDFLLGPRLLVAQPGARHVVRFEDPTVGDTLYAAPLTDPGRAVADTHELIDVTLPETLQGVLVQPFSADLRIRATVGGIEVGRAGGLTLSPAAEPEPAEVVLVPHPEDRLFAVAEWRGSAPFLEDRQRHAEAVSVATGTALARQRLDFARFYFAHAYGAEAGALLRLIEEDSAEAADHPEFRALRGAVRVVNRHPQAALADLDDARLRNRPETAMWRGAALAMQDRWEEAYAAFAVAGQAIRAFRRPLGEELALLSAEAALRVGDLASAEARLAWLVAETGAEADAWPSVTYLRGLIARATGDEGLARRLWTASRDGEDRRYRVLSVMALTDLDVAQGRLSRAAAAERLEGLRFAWRGDSLEFRLLERLGNLHWEAGEFRDALVAWQRAIDGFPALPATSSLIDWRDRRFVELFDGERLATIPPSTAVALFEDNADLVPDGPVGDRMTERLAERLVAMDLLDRAAALFLALGEDRLTDRARRATLTRAAAIRILDGEDEAALALLEGLQAETVEPDLGFEQRLLTAKALAHLDRGDEAMTWLADESGLDEQQIALLRAARLDVAWRNHDWAAAAAVLRQHVGAPPPLGQPIDASQAQLVIDYGIALALADDRAALDRLAVAFGPSMDDTAEANTFAIVTRAEGASGPIADLASVRRQVSEVDMFETFLASYATDPAAPPLTN